MLLHHSGYDVEVVTDARETLACLDSFRAEVILLDIAMPEVSGYELARQIRAQTRFDRLAIIALSGYADKPHVALSFESGCDEHVAKPVYITVLEAMLAAVIERRSQILIEGGPKNESAVPRHSTDVGNGSARTQCSPQTT